jgi:hypothetical protein
MQIIFSQKFLSFLHGRFIFLLFLSALTACGGGDGFYLDNSNNTTVNTTGMVSSKGGPLGLFQTWEEGSEQTSTSSCTTGIEGFTSCATYYNDSPTMKYYYLFFNDNGYVYEGMSSKIEDIICTETNGKIRAKNCSPYIINGNKITIGEKNKPVDYNYSAKTGYLKIGGYSKSFRPIPPAPPGFVLNGVYTYRNCSGSSCGNDTYLFRKDGSFENTGSNTFNTGYTYGGSSNNKISGIYKIDGYKIIFTPHGGNPVIDLLILDTVEKDIKINGATYSP